MANGVGDEFRDCLLDQGMIDEGERDVLRDVEFHLAAVKCFALDLDRRLEQLAHVAPFLFRPNDTALQPIHVEQIVDHSIEPARAVAEFRSPSRCSASAF